MTTSRDADWPRVEFGDVVRKLNKKVDPETSGLERYIAGEHMDTDNLKVSRWGTIGDGYLGPAFTSHFLPGQVLYGSRRTYLRKVAVPDFEGICANTTFVLESSSPELLQEFLPHVMSTESFHAFSISKSKGSVNPYINYSDLVDYEFVLPPVEKQHGMVKVISLMDEVIHKYGSAPTRSVHQALLSNLLEENGSKHVQLKEISEISYGYTESASPNPIGPKFLRITDIKDGDVDWSSVPFCKIDERTLERQRLGHGDIVFARTGSVGKSFLVVNPPEAVCASYLIRVQADRAQVLPEYLFFNFDTQQYWEQVRSGSSGSVQDGFNATKLGELDIVLPTLEIQAQIVHEMRKVELLGSKVSQAIKDLNSLRTRILNQLLTGDEHHVQ
jgi:type I restriction enzyme, S subunit